MKPCLCSPECKAQALREAAPKLADALERLRALFPREYLSTGRREYDLDEPLSGKELEHLDNLLREVGRLT